MSCGHLCVAEALTETVAENSVPSRKVLSQINGRGWNPSPTQNKKELIYARVLCKPF